jgi:hypothetical protein
LAVSLADCECDEERPTVLISANGNESIFVCRVGRIRCDTRLAREHRLDFFDRHAVPLALRPISLVPIKPLDSDIHGEIYGVRREIQESARYLPPYVSGSSLGGVD